MAFAKKACCPLANLTASFSFLSVLSGLSTAKRKFADSLNEFKFQCIGDAETDDEICIGELADMKSNIFSVPAEESLEIDNVLSFIVAEIEHGHIGTDLGQLGFQCFYIGSHYNQIMHINHFISFPC